MLLSSRVKDGGAAAMLGNEVGLPPQHLDTGCTMGVQVCQGVNARAWQTEVIVSVISQSGSANYCK